MLSIIVPVHNSEKYLRRCISSLLLQTYKDIEIILVENNSTDSSVAICKEYISENKNIRLLYEYKQGAAYARNLGIREAKGDYITFVDSDDYVQYNAYESLISDMDKYKCDIVCFSFHIVDEMEQSLGWYEPNLKRYTKKKRHFNGIEIAKIFLISKDIEGFGWNKIFRHSYVDENGIMFDETKTAFEDMAVFFEAIISCKCICLNDSKFYFYKQINTSLTHKDYLNKKYEYNDSINRIIRLAINNGLIRETDVFIASRFVWRVYNEIKNGNSIEEKMPYRLFRMVYLIMTGLKSEKYKTFVKLIYVYFVSIMRYRIRI